MSRALFQTANRASGKPRPSPNRHPGLPYLSLQRRQALAGFLFAVPSVTLFAAFAIYPILATFYISAFQYDLLTPKHYVGLSNYLSLFGDRLFLNSAQATLTYVLGTYTPLWFLSLAIALALNQSFRFRGALRVVYFTPVVMSMVIVAVIWKLMYHPDGLVNSLLSWAVKEPILWLTTSGWAPVAIIIMSVWKMSGYFMVIFLAGLQGIPHEYYEASIIDGANRRQMFRFITLPLLKPITMFVVIMSLIMGLQEFTPQYVMTGGGPADATRVIALTIYQTGFVYLKMGVAAAMSVLLFLAILAITLVQMRFFSERG